MHYTNVPLLQIFYREDETNEQTQEMFQEFINEKYGQKNEKGQLSELSSRDDDAIIWQL